MAGRRIRTDRVFSFLAGLLIIFSVFMLSLPVPQERSSIYLVSTEGVGEDVLALAKKGLENVYSNYTTVFVPGVIVPFPDAVTCSCNHYHADEFDSDLIDLKKGLNADYVILVTDADIYNDDHNGSLLGQASVYDDVAVVSYYRLRGTTNNGDGDGLHGDYRIMFQDTVVHEMGHLVGYEHSPDVGSVMYYAMGPSNVRNEPAKFNVLEEKGLANRFVKSNFYRNKGFVFSFLVVLSLLALAINSIACMRVSVVASSMAFAGFPYMLTLVNTDRRLEAVVFNHFGVLNMLLIFMLSIAYLSIADAKNYQMPLFKVMIAMLFAIAFFAVYLKIDLMIIGYFIFLISFAFLELGIGGRPLICKRNTRRQ